jgi:hypothetical protein
MSTKVKAREKVMLAPMIPYKAILLCQVMFRNQFFSTKKQTTPLSKIKYPNANRTSLLSFALRARCSTIIPINKKNNPKYKQKNALVEISASVQFVTKLIAAPTTPLTIEEVISGHTFDFLDVS